MNQHNSAPFTSHTNVRTALQELLRACLEWPPDVVADEVSRALFEEQAPEAMLARTTHQGVVRLINHYLRDAHVPDDPPEWLTLPVTAQVLQRLRLRAQ
jgi:hypothetical protein